MSPSGRGRWGPLGRVFFGTGVLKTGCPAGRDVLRDDGSGHSLYSLYLGHYINISRGINVSTSYHIHRSCHHLILTSLKLRGSCAVATTDSNQYPQFHSGPSGRENSGPCRLSRCTVLLDYGSSGTEVLRDEVLSYGTFVGSYGTL